MRNVVRIALVYDRRNGDQYVSFGYSDLGGGVQAHFATAYGENRDEAYEECKKLLNKLRAADGLPPAAVVERMGRVQRAVGSNFIF